MKIVSGIVCPVGAAMLSGDPTLSVAERVDAACDRFEAEWKAGSQPRIDDYLAAAPESDHVDLRQALRALELELQRRSETDTSISQSSVRSDGQAVPDATIQHVGGIVPSRAAVGRFEIRGVLGSGAFGKVYLAFDPRLGREVAVKVPLESTVKTENERTQFLKEARSAATINHPNVCQVHEVGEADGRPYIVMALVRGQSLADTLITRQEPLPEKQAALVVRKIALALAAAHDSGIVHRDLKPANVMFDRERKDIVVMDFGLARGPRLGDARGTQSGVIMGTPAYMSPEQARGDSKGVGPPGDIFSLGVILYELLAGVRPFSGTATEVIGQILHVSPEPPSRHRSGIDPRLEAACLKAMAKDPAARFATMKEFAAAVDAVLRAPTPAGPAADTARAGTTRQEGDNQSTSTSNNLAEVFAALSDDRKQARAETAAVVEAAIAKHRTPRWIFLLVGLLFVGGLTALGGIVFFSRSDKVEVSLSLVLKDVDLSDKSLGFFLDDEPVAADALAEPVELKPGVHIFTVKRGKDIVKRVEIRVEGGKNPGIQVEDITPPPEEQPHHAEPVIEPLLELPQNNYSNAPWLSPDGLTIYFQSAPLGTGGARQLWQAERKNPGAKFENLHKLFVGHDPAVASDGLEMIFGNKFTHWSAVRNSTKEDFGQPREIQEFVDLGFGQKTEKGRLVSFCLSEDGLFLWADQLKDGRLLGSVRLERKSRIAPWSNPVTVNAPAASRLFFISPKDGLGFCTMNLPDGGDNTLVVMSTNDGGLTFTNPKPIEVGNKIVRGKSPRYVSKTKELFFAENDRKEGGPTIFYVIRNFEPKTERKVAIDGKLP